MINTTFEILPTNRVQNFLRSFFLFLGAASIIVSFFSIELKLLAFFGVVFVIIGVLITVFTSNQTLKINQEEIVYESRSIVKEFSKKTVIPFKEIKETEFLKEQFLILGGRNPIADSDAQTLYNSNRIQFQLRDNEYKVIQQVGTKEEFAKAHTIIQNMIKK